MKEKKGHYVPPSYIPLTQSDADTEVETTTPNLEIAVSESTKDDPRQWSSGICACFDDMQSCMLLLSVIQTFFILLHESNLLKVPLCIDLWNCHVLVCSDMFIKISVVLVDSSCRVFFWFRRITKCISWIG